jgi:hypothetical protein
MTEITTQQLPGNGFLQTLAVGRIDPQAFGRLCYDLQVLAQEWRDATLVDKRLVSYLYNLVPHMGFLAAQGNFNEEDRRTLWGMARRLELLVAACFEVVREQSVRFIEA